MFIIEFSLWGGYFFMEMSHKDILESADFKQLVFKRWRISLILLITLFINYYGYITLVAYNRTFMATKIGASTTIGIPLGVLTILISWLLTVIYVIWANRSYDNEIDRLKKQIR